VIHTLTLTDDETAILNAVIEYIHETHRFPSCTELSSYTDINKDKCLKLCKDLVLKKELYIVFEGEGRPTIYVPYDMMQGLLRTQPKPEWIEKYSFKDEPTLIEKSSEIDEGLQTFEMFKRLLYATDIPLEEAVASSLSFLEFRDVIHLVDDPDNPDITMNYESKKVLIEVEGPKGQGKKGKVLQLDGWVKRELDEGKKADEVQGIYVVNHYRGKNPDERDHALSSHAIEFMKRYQFKLVTTLTLFTTVKEVYEGRLNKANAREKIWEGDKIDE